MVDTCTGINEIQSNLAFRIFPNPGSGLFNVSVNLNSPQMIDLTVIDALGNICFEKNQMMNSSTSNITLDLGTFSKGVYMVQLKGANGCAVKRLVID